MAGVSVGTTNLLAALADRARIELGDKPKKYDVSMQPGSDLDPFIPADAKGPREKQLHLGAAKLRDPVAATKMKAEGAMGAAREIALLAAHERGAQRGAMTRMRMIAMYRQRLAARVKHLDYGIPEGLVP